MSVVLFVHFMDALLSKRPELLSLRKRKFQVAVTVFDGDYALNEAKTAGGKHLQGTGICFDNKVKLELPQVLMKDVSDAANTNKFLLRMNICFTRTDDNVDTVVDIASLTVPLSTIIKTIHLGQRREHIFNLLNTLENSEAIARLRMGILAIIASPLEPPSEQEAAFFFSATKPIPHPVDLPRHEAARESGKILSKRVEAGNHVLQELQSLAAKLDVREKEGGELFVPIQTFTEFLRSHVTREAAAEISSYYHRNKHGDPTLKSINLESPPAKDVVMLFKKLIVGSSMVSLSSATIFTATRLKISTGATALAEGIEIKKDLASLEEEIGLVGDETVEMQLFFAKIFTPKSATSPSSQSALASLSAIEFNIACEKALQEIEACIETMQSAAQPVSSTADNNIFNYFASKLTSLRIEIDKKSDETIRLVNAAAGQGSSVNMGGDYHVNNQRLLLAFRLRAKKLLKLLTTTSVNQNVIEYDQQYTQADHVQKSNLRILLTRASEAFALRVPDRSLSKFTHSVEQLVVLHANELSSHESNDLASPETAGNDDVGVENDKSSHGISCLRVLHRLAALASLINDWSLGSNSISPQSVPQADTSDAPTSSCVDSILASLFSYAGRVPNLHRSHGAEEAAGAAAAGADDDNSPETTIANIAYPSRSTRLLSFLLEHKSCISSESERDVEPSPQTPDTGINRGVRIQEVMNAGCHMDQFVFSRGDEAIKLEWLAMRDRFMVIGLLLCGDGENHPVLDDDFSLLDSCGDGFALMFASVIIANHAETPVYPFLQLASSLAPIFGAHVDTFNSGAPEETASIDREISVLSTAYKLLHRCKLGNGKKMLGESELSAWLDANSVIETSNDLVAGKNILHLACMEEKIDPLLVSVLLSRKRTNPLQLDQFGKIPVQYTVKNTALQAQFLHASCVKSNQNDIIANLVTKRVKTKVKI